MENNNRQGCRWTKASEREPSIGDYYYCKVDTKQDCIVKTVVEWGEHKNGEFKYNDWDLDNVAHFGDFGEDAEVIEWLSESIEPCATSSENYWKQRCEAAERFINESPCDPDITKSQIYAHGIWQQLKNNPTDKEGG
jgi:hypothetical protein